MSPREAFQKSNYAKGFADVMDGAQMAAALQAAMLQFHATFDLPTTNETAAANEYRRQGAKQFLAILQNLTVNPLPPQPATGKQLEYTRK